MSRQLDQTLIGTILAIRGAMDKDIRVSETQRAAFPPSHGQHVTAGHIRVTPSTVAPNPLDQFRAWFKEAVEGGTVHEPEAMSLSTASKSGIPSSRMVAFRQLDTRGFVFYTNYTSRKSQELGENPYASLVFYWREIQRSIRIVGKAEKLSREEAEEYWNLYPISSKLRTWASRQSAVVREGQVQDRMRKLEERFWVHNASSAVVPVPDFWGGWRVIPHEIQFWSGKPSPVHDRIRYLREEGCKDGNIKWKIDRLSP